MKCYLDLKRKEIPTHATTQMNVDDIMLKWSKPNMKTKIHFYEIHRVVKYIHPESRRKLQEARQDEWRVIAKWI